MFPREHLFFGAIFSIILFLLFPQIGFLGFLIILFSSVLIDVDHYIYYVFKTNDWNLKHAYDGYIKKGKKAKLLQKKERDNLFIGIFFLHGFEFLFILLLASIFISKYFLFVLLGFNFHLLLDIIQTKKCFKRPIKVSLIYDILSAKNLTKIDFD